MNKKIVKRVAVILTVVALAGAPLFAQTLAQLPSGAAAVIGEWIYFGGQHQVEIDIDSDGEMEIQVKDLSARTETEWKGWWTVTANAITFSVYRMETENMVGWEMKQRQLLNETWTINYTLDASNMSMALTCANLPQQIASGTTYQRKW